jgi:hypothetical protein
MAAQGVPMRVLQEMLGHRDFKTTLIYADYAPSEARGVIGEAQARSRTQARRDRQIAGETATRRCDIALLQ